MLPLAGRMLAFMSGLSHLRSGFCNVHCNNNIHLLSQDWVTDKKVAVIGDGNGVSMGQGQWC